MQLVELLMLQLFMYFVFTPERISFSTKVKYEKKNYEKNIIFTEPKQGRSIY